MSQFIDALSKEIVSLQSGTPEARLKRLEYVIIKCKCFEGERLAYECAGECYAPPRLIGDRVKQLHYVHKGVYCVECNAMYCVQNVCKHENAHLYWDK
jgi:hypothetical protein